MSRLLKQRPFAPRDDRTLLDEMNALCRWHLAGCPQYRKIWPDFSEAGVLEELPYLHVGVFKHLLLRTVHDEIDHQRTLASSATTGNSPSRISLDRRSSGLQSQSSLAILKEMVGPELRPLLVLDSAKSLRRPAEVSARVAAAMSLRPLASEIHFLIEDADDPASVKWSQLAEILRRHDDLLVYGFTWILWSAWGNGAMPDEIRAALAGKRIHFVHSGGWKKLERARVRRREFDAALLADLSAESQVIDFYGLVEQVGVLYPLCEHEFRHVPRWADAIVRDPWTLEPLQDTTGQLQLINVLAYGAPYHSVLTEDLGEVADGPCPCGRAGRRFRLAGRVPKAEVRGCANV